MSLNVRQLYFPVRSAYRLGVQTPLSAEVPKFDDQEKSLVGVLKKTYEACLPTDVAGVTKPAACGTDKLEHFMGAGFALSDIYCDDFFRYANQAQRRRQYGRGLFNDAGAAVAGVLNLAKAGADALTASSVGFAAADGTFRNYESSFVVDPDMSKLRNLVLASQDSMKVGIEAAPPKTLYAAESKIRRYAGLCSFLGMKGLLNESLSRATEQTAPQPKPVAQVPPAPPPPIGAPAPPVAPPAAIAPASIQGIAPLVATRAPPG